MKFYPRKRRRNRKENWHIWFAWYPVYIPEKYYAWLECVSRRILKKENEVGDMVKHVEYAEYPPGY